MSNYYAPYYGSVTPGMITNLPGYGAGGGAANGGISAYSYSSSNGYAPQLPTVSLPRISYTERSLGDMMAEARNVIEPQYTTQLRQAGEGYADARTDLTAQYGNQRSGIEQSATDRGFGRASYVADALAQSQGHEKDDTLKLDRQYLNSMSGITDAREKPSRDM